MSYTSQKEICILAIDPYSRGFGFAVFEGPERLIDWGTKEFREERNSRCLKEVEGLIERNRPDAIVIEDYTAKGSRRCPRVRELLFEIIKLAVRKKVKIKSVSKTKLQNTFYEAGARTKHQIAKVIAKKFSEIELDLPPQRQCYMSEDTKMSVFDAVGWGLTFYQSLQANKNGPQVTDPKFQKAP